MSAPDRPVALISFAGSYVGPPLARLLAHSGHRLVLHQPSEALLDELRSADAEVLAVGAAGPGFMDGTGGLDTAEGNAALVKAAIDAYGRIDAACLVTGRIVVGQIGRAHV